MSYLKGGGKEKVLKSRNVTMSVKLAVVILFIIMLNFLIRLPDGNPSFWHAFQLNHSFLHPKKVLL